MTNYLEFIGQSSALTVPSVAGGDLGEVPVVISFHFEIKHFALGVAGLGDEEPVEQTLKKKQRNGN